ncbi:related to Bax inhibitor 1 [Saccharomycodes ludwigii]|uniref:Related to Bax inhibitor 1 n=1 Tax=Saccharomycodes ludwigii TaxID=36035 RepID=A0A376B750_9ASCO|nr:hypothetical protein SCDLUD_005027 [Saccharomycodes ludwigii]KAH3898703.1 hypothetical protein SCDLUD_005027 [Saccharomycodes ludwigii]SSD60526.1 related to Bax inhibitor 1 [Saccharomycodes ludwigii]
MSVNSPPPYLDDTSNTKKAQPQKNQQGPDYRPTEQHVNNNNNTLTGEDEQDLLFVPDDFKYDTVVISCDPSVRSLFIRKVYSLLGLQILGTIIFNILVYKNVKGLGDFIITHQGYFILTSILSLFFCVALCFTNTNRDEGLGDGEETQSSSWLNVSYRTQLLLLGLFTLCESYTLSIVSVVYPASILLTAAITTFTILLGGTFLAWRTNSDFAQIGKWYTFLNFVLWGMIAMGFVMWFVPYSSTMDLIYGWVGAILFSGYIYIDTYLVLRKVKPDEEIKCCMMLYLDIINLFLSILRILARNDDN